MILLYSNRYPFKAAANRVCALFPLQKAFDTLYSTRTCLNPAFRRARAGRANCQSVRRHGSLETDHVWKPPQRNARL
jgi:hypothetical protein